MPLLYMMEPAGADSGASTSFPKLEWEEALSLPKEADAPAALISHVKGELRVLFNIGKKRAVPEATLDKFIEPLALDKASVGFCKALLERVESLQEEHWNNGFHRPLPFEKDKEKDRLYSVMWE